VSLDIVVGLGWGDEGKGRIVDLLGEGASAVARFSGGANAGHTVMIEGRTTILHQVPTGLLRPGVLGLVGAGCVVDPQALCDEIDALPDPAGAYGRLFISTRVHLVHPAFKVMDSTQERARGGSAIGTTGFGIGPAYVRKYERKGIRLEDALDPACLSALSAEVLEDCLPGGPPPGMDDLVRGFEEAAAKLAARAADVGDIIRAILARGETVLAEGAQGTLIDPDHGTYPFVTCGSCVSSSACVSLGVGPSLAGRVVGVMKAYSTRVGSGPFPTEICGPLGDHIRERGHEYGRATGRPRRCGWFDAVLSSYSAALNGCTEVVVTLLDVLDDMEEISVCTSYEGAPGRFVPGGRALGACRPVYEILPGWKTDIRGERRWESLPQEARDYVEFLERRTGVPVTMISTGPERSDLIRRNG
jgi:adenylosuccinate synthase